MTLKDYFENTEGTGVLATADGDGAVDAAIYARPHMLDEQTAAFIMADKRSHQNLQSNPHAMYLFHEKGEGYAGKRLALTLTSDEANSPDIMTLRRRSVPEYCQANPEADRYLVKFRVDEVRPLVGG